MGLLLFLLWLLGILAEWQLTEKQQAITFAPAAFWSVSKTVIVIILPIVILVVVVIIVVVIVAFVTDSMAQMHKVLSCGKPNWRAIIHII